jgi:hypothetical protein
MLFFINYSLLSLVILFLKVYFFEPEINLFVLIQHAK